MNKSLNKLKRLAFINRQPSLWRHSCVGVQIEAIEDGDNDSIQISPLMLEALNADFDGDTCAIYIVHDIEALKELEQKAFWMNTIHYDQNSNFLSTIRYEALYAAFVLTRTEFDKTKIILELKNLSDLPEDIELWNNQLYSAVKFKNKLVPYGMCLFNKWCGFDDIIINKSVKKNHSNEISKLIFESEKDNKKYYDRLTDLEKKLFFFISVTKHSPSLDVLEMVNLKDDETTRLLKQIPNDNIMLGYYINESLVERCLKNFDKESNLYKLFKSGSRFSKLQLARSCISIGYSADANNNITPIPIKTSLLEGLTEEEFFIVAPGTRKSIQDKSKWTPDSGYLERTVVMGLSVMELESEDCGTEHYLEIIVTSQKHAQTLVGKYYRDPQTTELEWKVLTFLEAIKFINRTIYIRSLITCEEPNFKICKKCFGAREFPTKYVGITAGQSVVERITQLILRTFHVSGGANLPKNNIILEFFRDHLINVENIEKNINISFKENPINQNTELNIQPKLTILTFDTNEFPDALIDKELGVISGLMKTDYKNNQLSFRADSKVIKNEDVIAVMNQVKNVLKQESKLTKSPKDYYQDFMTLMLSVGTVYSSFIEMLFANMFLVDYDNKVFWRYNQDKTPTFKLGDKQLASYISPLLGLLYQPNKNSVEKIDLNMEEIIDSPILTIYEKIWLGQV